MKHPFLLLLALFSMFVQHVSAQSVVGEITQLDPSTGTFTITAAKGAIHTFKTKITTEVRIDQKLSKLQALALGTRAIVTPGEPGFAAKIVTPPPGAEAKIAAGQSLVKVPATALKENPVVVGSVTAGQKVTVTPKKVWWSGGGSKKGVFCDWRGYTPNQPKGIPWMALVAAVGTDEHWAKDNTLSFTVAANGTLVLYASDGKGGNEGGGEVIVKIDPK